MTEVVLLLRNQSLAAALKAVEVAVDVNAGTTEQAPATQFLTEVADALRRTSADRGVGHIVTPSVVGTEHAPFWLSRSQARARARRSEWAGADTGHAGDPAPRS